MYLITYHYRNPYDSKTISDYGMRVVECPIKWLLSVQKCDETYILINAQPITEEQAKQIDGNLEGM